MKKAYSNIRFATRSWCGYHPLLLKTIGAIRGFQEQVCSKKTDIVVEAFPRCANTYSVAAFEHIIKKPSRKT